MGRIGEILGIEPNVEDAENTIDIKVDLGGGDVLLVPMYTTPGEDSRPMVGDYAILTSHPGDAGLSCVGFIDATNATESEDGEKLIYSRDLAGLKAGYIHIKRDATVTILGDDDNAVRFSKLKTAFDALKDDFNNLVTAYNAHIHITTATVATGPAGVIAPTTSTGTPSQSSVDAAKIEEIKVP